MNSFNYWELIDTSIKVGLGAIIAGFFAWMMNRQKTMPMIGNSSRENRRLAALEEISGHVGNVTHIFAKYSALAIESIRFGHRWPQARREELELVNAELVREFKKMADAEARLLMLGEKAMEHSLRLYGARIAYFRKQVYIGRKDISSQEIADLKQEVQKVRAKFYDLLSQKYDRLLASA